MINSILAIIYLNILHVGHISAYHFSQVNQEFQLKFTIERNELMNFDTDLCDFEGMTALCVSNYLNENTSVIVNGTSVTFELVNATTESNYLIVYLKATDTFDQIDKVEIINNCFYEFNDHFLNRVSIDICDIKKSYILSNQRRKLFYTSS